MSFIINLLTLLLCMSAFAAAQDTCNCSPIQYTFVIELDDHKCPVPPDSVTPDDAFNYFGPGVQKYTCQPQKRATKITYVKFIPYDSSLFVIPGQIQIKNNLELTNGDSLTFTSPTTNPPIVGMILLSLRGVDEDGERISSDWTIHFTNECGVLSLEDGTKFGWVIFRDLVHPSQELCPMITAAPTIAPTSNNGSYSYSLAYSKPSKAYKSKASRSKASKS